MRSTSRRAGVLGLAGSLLCASAGSAGLGRIGATYPITEVDARRAFEAEMARPSRSSKDLQESSRKAATQFLDRLPAIEGIGRVEKNSTRHVDATHVVERELADDQGRLLAPAGTRVDLLRRTELEGVLFVLDGRDPLQVNMLERLWRANMTVHPILVGGSYTALTQRFGRPFFYDYGGAISARFGITRVPALVGQDGARIRVEELKP